MAFFQGSRNVVIDGGTFTASVNENIFYSPQPEYPSCSEFLLLLSIMYSNG